MSEILVQDKELVVPGQVLATGLDYLPGSGSYRQNNEIRSKLVGPVKLKERLVSIVPLAGVYMPKPGDGIIATVSDLQSSFWIMNINSPYDAILQLGEAVKEYVDLSKSDLTNYYDIGDVIYAKVLNVSQSKHISITMNIPRARKLIGGRLLDFPSSKVPRLIGKAGSMIELIKSKTGCQIIVGQNGIAWLKGENEALAVKAIRMVEEQAHMGGLTDRITEMLNTEAPDTPLPSEKQAEEFQPDENVVEQSQDVMETSQEQENLGGEQNEVEQVQHISNTEIRRGD